VTVYKYKVRKALGYTGVSLYDEDNCLDTITQFTDMPGTRRASKELTKELNVALNKGREEILRFLASYLRKDRSCINETVVNDLEKQYKHLLS
jgi:hypothetical protein